jgi:hypothetical protein
MEMIMARYGKLGTNIAAFAVVWLANGPAKASTFIGELPVGYSDNLFQISGGTSSLVINIDALGTRDPAICGACNSIYTDSFTVNLFDQTGKLLKSAQEINYFYSNIYSNSHGIGAGPVWIAVPAGATALEVESRLSIAGLLGPDRNPLSFGNLNISSDGTIAAATPIPSTLPLLASGLAVLGLLGWRRKQKRAASFSFLDHHQQSKAGALASA